MDRPFRALNDMTKKTILILIIFFAFSITAQAKEQVTLTDLAGREIQISVPVDHLILGESRFLPTLGILDKDDPTKRVVGMMEDLKKYDPATYGEYQKYFPQIDAIPLIGSTGEISFSIEKAFTVHPDVAFFGLGSGHGPNDKSKTIIKQLEAAGIPVVILDFRINPLENTPKSLALLGEILGKEKEAENFLSFYQEHLSEIQKRLKNVETRPSVFMESHVGLQPQCCRGFGRQMMGLFIEWAGGKNAFGDLIPGTVGEVNVEHLIISQPDVYIGTAIGSSATTAKFPNFIALGPKTDEATAQETLENALTRTGIAQLNAVKKGQAHAIWHHFYNTPMNIVAVETLAKWLHPEVFKDIDPHKTLEAYFQKFQAVPLNGIYWTSRNMKDAS